MLRFLRVSNLAVVREVSLELRSGLTVLTGETGAGKSILVDALLLLLGGRASADLLRTGADSAAVEGIFRIDQHPQVLALLSELGAEPGAPDEPEGGELVLRRELGSSGRSRTFINGALNPVGALRRLGVLLADIYGQLEHVRLLDASTHLDLLDHVAGLGALRAELTQAYQRLREVDRRVRELKASEAERTRRADFLRFELNEIGEAAPRPGEDEELGREQHVLANLARVLELAESGYQELYEAEGAVLGRLAALGRGLEELGGYDARLSALGPQAEAARAALEDIALTLRDHARSVPLEPERLERVDARLAALDRLKRKYGPTLADVVAFAERGREELATLVVSAEEREKLEEERQGALATYVELAAQASRARRSAARRLERRVEEELAELAMEKARLRVRLGSEEEAGSTVVIDGKPLAFGPFGTDRVEFHVSTNLGEEPRPLARVASGGELSRMLLALRTVAADHEPSRIAVFHGLEAGLGSRVAVFDEVDAGIGGRVAYVLARKLRRLARGRQVLCITHLAPVAAAADHHLRVRKEERRGRTEVMIEALAGEARLAELGRMIGGDQVTEAVRRHAEELLATAAADGAEG